MERFEMARQGLVVNNTTGPFCFYADAQATIAALQAQLATTQRDNRLLIEHITCARAEIEYKQQQLTQRTVELEAANKLLYKKNCALGRAETIINDLQAELERVREKYTNLAKARFGDKLAHPCLNLHEELERVRGELAETKEEVKCLDEQVSALNQGCLEYERLVKALPKVEGEITVSADPNGWYVMPLLIRCVTKEQADGIAALLQQRQNGKEVRNLRKRERARAVQAATQRAGCVGRE